MVKLADVVRLRARRGDVRGLRGLLRMKAVRVPPPSWFWSELLQATWRAEGAAVASSRLVEEMRRAGTEPTPFQYSTMIQLLTAEKRQEGVLSLFKERFFRTTQGHSACSPPPAALSLAECNAFLRSCSVFDDARAADWALDVMKERRIRPSSDTFVELLTVHRKNMDRSKAIVEEMGRHGLVPGTAEYTVLLKSCLFANDADAALEYMASMSRAAIAPDGTVLSLLLLVLVKKGRISVAIDIFRGLRALEETVLALWREKEHVFTEELLEKMVQQGLALPHWILPSAVEDAFRARSITRVERLCAWMKQQGMSPVFKALLWMMQHYARMRQLDRLCELLGELEEGATRFDTDMPYKIVMAEQMRRGQIAQAIQLYERMVAKGRVAPTGHTKSQMIRAFGLLRDTDAARRIFDSLARPSCRCYTELILAYFRNGAETEGLSAFRRLQTSTVPMDAAVFGLVMKQFAKSGDVDRARALFQQMTKRYGVKADVHVYNRYMEVFLRAGDSQAALQILEEMKLAGLKPNVETNLKLGGGKRRSEEAASA